MNNKKEKANSDKICSICNKDFLKKYNRDRHFENFHGTSKTNLNIEDNFVEPDFNLPTMISNTEEQDMPSFVTLDQSTDTFSEPEPDSTYNLDDFYQSAASFPEEAQFDQSISLFREEIQLDQSVVSFPEETEAVTTHFANPLSNIAAPSKTPRLESIIQQITTSNN